MRKSCGSCTHLMTFNSVATQYRCGVTYFSEMPSKRKISRSENYPLTELGAWCDKHRASGEPLATESFVQGRLC